MGGSLEAKPRADHWYRQNVNNVATDSSNRIENVNTALYERQTKPKRVVGTSDPSNGIYLI